MIDIIGAGGGKNSGGGGSTDPDSLDSHSSARVLDLLSEGEVEGVVDGLKGVFFNNTPVQNADGTNNFSGVTIKFRTGTASQTLIPGFDEASQVVTVGVTVTTTAPQTISVSETDVDAVRLTISVPQLQFINDDGDIKGTSVELAVDIQENSGGFTELFTDKITGRTGDLYQRQYEIDLEGRTFPIDIKVRRITEDSSNPKKINAFSLATFTKVTYTDNTYNNSALASIRVNAEQFSSIPTRMYRLKGVKVRIPSNATVRDDGSLAYSGVWNGTFAAATYTNDPAWCLYDLLTSQRYGLGDHILTESEKTSFNGNASKLDKFAFFSASQYSSALIEDFLSPVTAGGFKTGKSYKIVSVGTTDFTLIGATSNTVGQQFVASGAGSGTGTAQGLEPRFSLNVNLQKRSEAYDIINSLCSVFRAMPYYSSGSLTVAQDSPQDTSYLFNRSNVDETGFTYQGSSQKARATVAIVKYFDMDLRTQVYEEVKDDDAIAKYGVITKNIDAFGCTSRGQAFRVGKWLLQSESIETETVSFTTSIDAGVIVRPGQVIEISDPVRAGFRRGGRIKSGNITQVTVDDTALTDLPANSFTGTRTLSVVLPDGSVETRDISDITGANITVQTAFSQAPNANTVWVVQTTGGGTADIQTSTWRVVSVVEADSFQFTVTALSYNASKFAAVEQAQALTFRDISNLNEIPATPEWKDGSASSGITQQLYKYRDEVRVKVLARWKPVLGVNEYEVRWRVDDGNWNVRRQQGTDYEILNTLPGSYEFKIFALNAALVPSAVPLTGTFNSEGKTARPSTVTGFSATIDQHIGVVLNWDDMKAGANADDGFADLDITGYEIRKGSSWDNNDVVATTQSTTLKIGNLEAGAVTYHIKAFDADGNYSLLSTFVIATITGPTAPSVSGTVVGDQIILTWSDTSQSYAVANYEVRTAEDGVLDTSTATRFSTPVNYTGNRVFFVKAIDFAGNQSSEGQVTVSVSQAIAPSISHVYEGRQLRLNWSEVNGTTRTRQYEVRQGGASSTFATANIIGRTQGTTFSLEATWSAAQKFFVVALDANNNFGSPGSVDVPLNLPGQASVNSVLNGEFVVLSWDPVAAGSIPVAEYEVRRGSVFSSATVKTRASATRFQERVDWSGTQTYWIVGIDSEGNFGTEANINVSINAPAAVPTFKQEVIDNNVLLRWSEPTSSLPIINYRISKGSSSPGTLIGNKLGLFTTVFESVAGTFTYRIVAIDSANNIGAEAVIDAKVDEPPDFVLNLDQTSTFNGTKTNAFEDDGNLFVCVDTTETWQQHFSSAGYNTIQDQIDDGKDLYALPSLTTGSYVEEIDYGAVLASTRIQTTLTSEDVVGTTTITPKISTKLNAGDSYTDFAGQDNVFATNFRYIKVTYDFSSSGNDDILKITQLRTKLFAKSKTDQGTDTVSNASTGKTVSFVKTFIDIDSINVTPRGDGSAFLIPIVDFTDVANPTSFTVFLLNASGTKVTGNFDWTCRGV